MPFDFATSSVSVSAPSLTQAATLLGLTPISPEDLDDHKRAEQAKHPGNWFYRHETTTVLLLGVAALLGGLCAVVGAANHNVMVASVGFALVVGLTISVVWGIEVTAPAIWVEHRCDDPLHDRTIPLAVARMAVDLIDQVPGSYAVVGTLMQGKATLDPYLLVRTPHQNLILAIWDDHGVIRTAASPPT